MSYALSTLWYERQRYLPGVLAVGFSALLIALQCGLLLGLFSITSMPIDHTVADVWMGAPGVLIGRSRPAHPRGLSAARMAAQPEVERCEVYLQGSPTGPSRAAARSCAWSSARGWTTAALGAVDKLTPELRTS